VKGKNDVTLIRCERQKWCNSY